VTDRWRIRSAAIADAPRLAALAVQLGYPVDGEEAAGRVAVILENPDTDLFAALAADDEVIGWLQVELKRSLISPLAAQVMALVVDEQRRGAGAGAALLAQAEAWAVGRGCIEMLVATRVTRERAHGFYRRNGYRLVKTSHIFGKSLA
jgi:GNAT superfamily N-acetyltransferase